MTMTMTMTATTTQTIVLETVRHLTSTLSKVHDAYVLYYEYEPFFDDYESEAWQTIMKAVQLELTDKVVLSKSQNIILQKHTIELKERTAQRIKLQFVVYHVKHVLPIEYLRDRLQVVRHRVYVQHNFRTGGTQLSLYGFMSIGDLFENYLPNLPKSEHEDPQHLDDFLKTINPEDINDSKLDPKLDETNNSF